jgi:hypothetical protein
MVLIVMLLEVVLQDYIPTVDWYIFTTTNIIVFIYKYSKLEQKN